MDENFTKIRILTIDEYEQGIQQMHTKIYDLQIIRQPQSAIRFRTESDPLTHGVIRSSDSSSSSSDCFPAIQLQAFEETDFGDFFVEVDCFINDESNVDQAIRSPHIFGHKRKSKEKTKSGTKKQPTYDKITEPIIERMVQKSPGLYEYIFKNYFIISQAKKGLKSVLEKYEKISAKGLINENLDSIVLRKNDIQKSNKEIRLGFTIYKKINNERFLYCLGPALTTLIQNADKKFSIKRLCNERGNINGGDIITLLVNIPEKNIIIVMTDNKDWEIEIKEFIDIHENAAITFRLPPYKGKQQGGDITCYIYLKRKDGSKSPSSRFIYERSEEPIRKRRTTQEDLYCEKFCYNKNKIFHEPIEFDRLLHNYISVINDTGDTLLHSACEFKRSGLIRSLIGMKCDIWTQNKMKQTPLHLAIENHDYDTLKVWTDLINHLYEYEHFHDSFKRALCVYNKRGFTVLHAAIINDQRELVEAILKFYKSAKIDLNEYEVLGTGDTILHLSIAKHLPEMFKLIIKIEPKTLLFKNYSGQAAIEDCDYSCNLMYD